MFRSALARTASLAATSFLALAITSVAHAQSAPAQSGSPEQPGTALEAPSSEIIVTAQKRSERVNDVGMSIQALSNVALSNAGIAAPQDLVKIVPGFNSNPTPYGSNVFTLRGIGYQETTLSAAPTVTVYSDEVPIPFSPETAGVALDLQRVEVLKGPQGTLYGQNSTGGLINFIAARPTDNFSAGGEVSYGRFDAVDC